MNLELKRFFKHSVVYTLGNFIYRGASLLLIPLYAHYLTPEEYGMLEIFTVTAAIFGTLFSSGVAHAALRFYFEYPDQDEKNTVISTALIASFIFSLAGVIVLSFFAPFFSVMLFGDPSHALPFRLAFCLLVLEISREISLAFIRAKEKSKFFVIMSVFQLVVQVAANFYMVVVLKIGVVGILTGNLLATFIIWLILTSYTIRSCGFRFDWKKLWPVVKYGNPLMLSSLASAILYSSDRYLLNAYASLGAIGLYALGSKMAKVLPMVVVDPFTKSFGPFRFSVMKQSNAQQIYARIMTYYVFISGFLVIALSVFSRELIMLISSSSYWEAYRIVPILLIPGALGGITYVFQTGIYIQKRTDALFYITTASGLLNLVGCLLFIPSWGIHGAAIASLLSVLCTVFLTYVVSNKIYPVDYEFRRIGKIVIAATLVGVVAFLIHFENRLLTIFLKLLIISGFPFLAGAMGVFTPEEICKMGEIWQKIGQKLHFKAAVL